MINLVLYNTIAHTHLHKWNQVIPSFIIFTVKGIGIYLGISAFCKEKKKTFFLTHGRGIGHLQLMNRINEYIMDYLMDKAGNSSKHWLP